MIKKRKSITQAEEPPKQDPDSNHTISSIDEYIASQPVSIQPILHQVRLAIRKALPDAQERISWRMPTFWLKHNIIHFAAFTNHMGLYPGPEAIEAFADRLGNVKRSKGAIQFPYDQPIPLDLIADIARWCYEKGDYHGEIRS